MRTIGMKNVWLWYARLIPFFLFEKLNATLEKVYQRAKNIQILGRPIHKE